MPLHSSQLPRYAPIAKPARGSRRVEKLAERSAIEAAEARAKLAAKVRDGYACRVPGCTTNTQQWRLESAHLKTKGMGGDHGLHSHARGDYVTCCFVHHQGPRSLHSGDLRATPITPSGGDGLVQWDELTEAGWVTRGIN